MSIETMVVPRAVDTAAAAKLQADRARYVPRGMASSSASFAVAADGAWITDAEGRRFLDFATGISVLNVGHRHPRVQAAIKAQLEELDHSGAPVMMPAVYVQLAKRLCELTPGSFEKRALLVNSGAEAVENAVKVVRQATGRSAILTFQGAFHGRTLLTMTMTGKVHPYRQNFGPYAAEIYRLPYPNPYRRPGGLTIEEWTDYCLAAVRMAFATDAAADQVAGVFVEPVQGEGGFVVPPADFLARLAMLCREYDIPLVVDEIQTGLGRTGTLFASEQAGVEPDLILVAKSIAAGLPLAAVIGRAELMDSVEPGGVGGTYGGNALACAAALAVLEVIADEGLPERAQAIGRTAQERMRAWQGRYPAIGDVRGIGAMVAMEFVLDPATREPDPATATKLVRACDQRGLIVLKAGLFDNVVRFLPPLTLTDGELDLGLGILEAALGAVLGGDSTTPAMPS